MNYSNNIECFENQLEHFLGGGCGSIGSGGGSRGSGGGSRGSGGGGSRGSGGGRSHSSGSISRGSPLSRSGHIRSGSPRSHSRGPSHNKPRHGRDHGYWNGHGGSSYSGSGRTWWGWPYWGDYWWPYWNNYWPYYDPIYVTDDNEDNVNNEGMIDNRQTSINMMFSAVMLGLFIVIIILLFKMI